MQGAAWRGRKTLMPLPIYLSHRLVERQAMLRKDGRLPWARPDAKSQVTIRYVDGKPHSIDTVVLSTQHSPDISLEDLRESTIEQIIKPVLPKELIKGDIKFLVLESVGLPTEAIAILLPIDRLLDTVRTAVNVEGDMIGSLVVEHVTRTAN